MVCYVDEATVRLVLQRRVESNLPRRGSTRLTLELDVPHHRPDLDDDVIAGVVDVSMQHFNGCLPAPTDLKHVYQEDVFEQSCKRRRPGDGEVDGHVSVCQAGAD